MEPESLSIMSLGGKSFAFIGFERNGVIAVFDITDPASPTFVDAVTNHPANVPIDEAFAQKMQGDMDPEGLFASSMRMKLFVAGSVSNTVSQYDIVMN